MPYFDTTIVKSGRIDFEEKLETRCFPGKFTLENQIIDDSSFSNIYNRNIAYTRFKGTVFQGNFKVNNVDFKFNSNFESSRFEKRADFISLNNGASIDLSGSHFKGNASFIGNSVSSITFKDVLFDNHTSFSGHYTSTLIFDRTVFQESTDFSFSQFKELFLYETKFSSTVIFSLCVFLKAPRIHEIVLPKKIFFERVDLSKLSSTEFVDFRLAKLAADSSKCIIHLEGTDLSKLLLPFNLFQLGFSPNTTYEMKCGIYEAILKSCKDAGMLDSYKGWDIEYNKMKNTHDLGVRGEIKNVINEYWWNFGYDKWRILWIWLPSVFLLFLIINVTFINKLIVKMYFDEDLGSSFLDKRNKMNVLTRLNHFSFRLSYSIFYTATIYFGLKLKHEAVNFQNFWYLIYLYLIFCIGAIHMAFALSYILDVY